MKKHVVFLVLLHNKAGIMPEIKAYHFSHIIEFEVQSCRIRSPKLTDFVSIDTPGILKRKIGPQVSLYVTPIYFIHPLLEP